MSAQAEALENDFSEDFDDDDAFLNLDEEDSLNRPQKRLKIISESDELLPIASSNIKDVVVPTSSGQSHDLEVDPMNMDEDSDIFLQVEDGSSYAKDPPGEGSMERLDRSPVAVYSPNPEANNSFSHIPASNFQVTPPDFDDSDDDDELFSKIDLDFTSTSPEKMSEVSQESSQKSSFVFTTNTSTSGKSNEKGVFPGKTFTNNNSQVNLSVSVPYESSESASTSKSNDKANRRDSKSTSIPSRKTPSTRRFPGPAGLIPTLKPVEFNCLDLPKKSNPISRKIHEIISSHQDAIPAPAQSQINPNIYCSQEEKSVFERRACVELMFYLRINSEDADAETPLNLMNIDWILTKARRLPGCLKIPFLLAVIQETPELLTGNGKTGKPKTPCVTLADPTGSIDAAFDANFLNVHGNDLRPGTALALKNIGLLRSGKRHLMLTITERNIICMTSIVESEDQNMNKAPVSRNFKSKARKTFTTNGGVRVTEFCDFNPEKILECYHQMNIPLNMGEDEDEQPLDLQNIFDRNRPVTLFETARQTAPSFIPPRSTAVTTVNSDTAFISNRFTVPAHNNANAVASAPTDAGSDFGDDDDEDFLRTLDEIGLLNNTDLDTTFD